MKKNHIRIIVIVLILVMLVIACNFADRFSTSVAELESTSAGPLTATPTLELTSTLQPTVTDLPTATQTETPLPSSTPTETPLPSPTLTETPLPTPTFTTMINPIDGAVMVYVPEGEFLMGSEDEDADPMEKPEHMVYLDAFWIYQNPVTNENYQACVNVGACRLPDNVVVYNNPNYADYPVLHVNWFDADNYCKWARGQLPTEAQWEKAARGTDGRTYPWGNEEPNCDLGNFFGQRCVGGNTPVGSYPLGASPYGALDMAGNINEWVADWYNFYMPEEENINPTGPATGTERVVRLGDWTSFEISLRVTYRTGRNPNNSSIYFGFRCMRWP